MVRTLNDPAVRHGGYEGYRTPVSAEDVTAKLEADDRHLFLACRKGTPIGSASLKDIDLEGRKAEPGYWIAPDEQGNAYATEAADLCLTHAFDELGLHEVWARTVGDNDASNRVLEKLGFQREGVIGEHWYGFGRDVDEHRFGLLESERQEFSGAQDRHDHPLAVGSEQSVSVRHRRRTDSVLLSRP
ncbi:GNAT family N-acetyltransferase [Natrinema caseinilyticum]|uniref:GNAT family N-acetyltransferase n=1 Tax=Natrinema caseinilyticum TaxID=2961570 RepID=UPI003CCD8C9A